jgi:copper transport protein
VLTGLLPPLASAHPGYAGVDRLGDRVRMEFEAPIEEAFLRLEVRDAGGVRVSGAPRRDPRDPRGVVADLLGDPGPGGTVTWRAMAQDGHAQGGVVRLADGSGIPGADAGVDSGNAPLTLIARVLLLLGPLVVAGAMFLAGWVLAPSLREGGVRPPGGGDDRSAFAARAEAALAPAATAWWRALLVAGAAWLLGLVLQPPAVLLGLGAGAGDLPELLTETRLGVAWWVQAGALSAVVAVALVAGAGGPAPRGFPRPALCAVGAAAASAALLAISWSGHASTGKDRSANIAIDALHNLATAAWIGGLVALVAILPAIASRLGPVDRLRLSAGVVVRFSGLAVASVAVLVVTGVYRALAELGDAGDLLDTAYGLALLVKLVMFGGLLAMGAVNRFVYHPRLERAALGLDPDDRGAAGRLAVSVRAEVLLALALIAVVGVMVGFPPPG